MIYITKNKVTLMSYHDDNVMLLSTAVIGVILTISERIGTFWNIKYSFMLISYTGFLYIFFITYLLSPLLCCKSKSVGNLNMFVTLHIAILV